MPSWRQIAFSGILEAAFEAFILSKHAQVVIYERSIAMEWIRFTLENPEITQPDRKDSKLTHGLTW
jgi:hypothetical protein